MFFTISLYMATVTLCQCGLLQFRNERVRVSQPPGVISQCISAIFVNNKCNRLRNAWPALRWEWSTGH